VNHVDSNFSARKDATAGEMAHETWKMNGTLV